MADWKKWIKNKGVAIKPKTNDNRCFCYAVAAALNYESIGAHPERISKINTLIQLRRHKFSSRGT